MYRIYISSFNGYVSTGIVCKTEKEAKELCFKFNTQDDNPFAYHVYEKI